MVLGPSPISISVLVGGLRIRDPNAEDALALLGNAYADIGEPLKAEAALQQATISIARR
jgi:hypothetical protein